MRVRLPGVFVLLAILFIGVFVITQPAASQNFIEPGSDAPGGAIVTPLNASSSSQLKAGTLVVGDGGDRFCLNADATLGATLDQIAVADNVNCISSWSDISNALGTRFVLRAQSGITGNQLLPSNYPHQSGYARIQSTGVDQGYSLIATAPPICVEDPPGPGGWQQCGTGPSQEFCFCANGGSACLHNDECVVPGAPLQPASTVGLYASSGGQAGNDAGVFGGRVHVYGGPYIYGSPQPGRICLNGTSAVHCISSWDQIGSIINAFVLLQGYSIGSGPSPSQKQLGTARIDEHVVGQGTNGLSHSSAILAGDPNSVGSVDCDPAPGLQPCICGDGHCAASFENSTNCPTDCQAIQPANGVNLGYEIRDVLIYVTPSSVNPSNLGHVLITRTTNSSSTVVPVSGVRYAAGMPLSTSDDTVVVHAADNNGSGFAARDTTATTGVTYYYKVYMANRYPRYSAPVTRSVQLTSLTVTRQGPSAGGGFGGLINNFFCFTSAQCSGLVVYEPLGVTETLDVLLTPNYNIVWTGACTGGGGCVVLMNGPKTVTGTFVQGGGGGGGGGFDP